MKMKYLTYVLLAILMGLTSCSNKQKSMTNNSEQGVTVNNDEMEMGVDAATNKPVEENVKKISDTLERKIIKTGNITIKCNDIDKTRDNINNLLKKYKGYSSKEEQQSYDNKTEYRFTVRVPAESFDVFVKNIAIGKDNIESKSIEVSDVTEEYMDVKTRINTKKEVEKRYLDLLKKANSIGDILEIQQKAGEIREDIETAEGKIRFMNDRIIYSTLEITCYKETATRVGFGYEFRKAFSNGGKYFIWLFVGITHLWPFIIFAMIILFIIIFVNKRNKKNKININDARKN